MIIKHGSFPIKKEPKKPGKINCEQNSYFILPGFITNYFAYK